MGELIFFDKGKKPQKWIQFDEDTEILLEYTEKDDLDELKEKAIEMATVNQREDGDKIFNMLLGKEKVKGWRKIDDHNHPGFIMEGKPFEFNEKNVKFMMNRHLRFSQFVSKNILKLKNFVEAKAKAAIKN